MEFQYWRLIEGLSVQEYSLAKATLGAHARSIHRQRKIPFDLAFFKMVMNM
jgi:hypothetical protein